MAKQHSFNSESELAAVVVDELSAEGWDIYCEVGSWGSTWADIVAVRGPLLLVVETKLSMSLNLLNQAVRWLGAANQIVMATPQLNSRRGPLDAVYRFCNREGIGWWRCDGELVYRTIRPRLWRRRHEGLRDALRDEHKTAALPGTNRSGRWSPFRATVRELKEYVEENPGVTMKSAVAAIGHHYSSDASARQGLAKRIRDGVIVGITTNVVSGKLCLFPEMKVSP